MTKYRDLYGILNYKFLNKTPESPRVLKALNPPKNYGKGIHAKASPSVDSASCLRLSCCRSCKISFMQALGLAQGTDNLLSSALCGEYPGPPKYPSKEPLWSLTEGIWV